jgi:hypothetical protein
MSIERYFEQSDTPASNSPVGALMVRVLAKNPSMSFEDALARVKSLPPQAAGRNDRHDIDWRELKLLRVGHYLWAIYKKECGKSGTVSEEMALESALRQVWDLKKELRRELKTERAARAELVRERFGKAKLPLAEPADIGLPGTGLRVEVESRV